MTEAGYIATAARTGKPFTFTRKRGNATQAFLPGEGTRMTFTNRAADTLEIVGVPSGFLLAGDKVTVAYLGTTVFQGEVDTRIENLGRGDDATETVTVTGPWAKMSRLVFRQSWRTGASGSSLSSRLILNQATDGSSQSLNVALAEIAWGANNGAPAACGYQIGTGSISVSTQALPFDECRDITIADAIVRELRFFPAAVARFDYSTATPTLHINMPSTSGNDAAYVAAIPKTVRQHVYNAHPITGVDLEIESSGDVDGVTYRTISHQTAGNTAADNPDCLYATLQLAGFSSSSVSQSFTAEVETPPQSPDDAIWWKDKHPRLANVAQNAIAITNGARSGAATASQYPNISSNTVGEIQAAGLRARVETWTCDCTITTADDVEEQIKLQMQFVTTNATNKTYRWLTESSATTGEAVPSGLAAAILAARSGELKEERFTMRLGTVAQWPTIGDLCDGLILQDFSVDCATLTAELHFGTPDYLSPEDMAGLLTGFRNKRRSTLSTSRVSGKKSDDGTSDVDMGGVQPLSSTEFAPGTKVKTTIQSSETVTPAATRGGTRDAEPPALAHGKIVLDCEELDADETMEVTELDNGVKVLATGLIAVGGMFRWTPPEDPTAANPTGTIGPGGVFVGRKFYTISSYSANSATALYSVKVEFGTGGVISPSVVSSISDANATLGKSPTDTVCYIPIYELSNWKIVNDYRGSFVVPCWE